MSGAALEITPKLEQAIATIVDAAHRYAGAILERNGSTALPDVQRITEATRDLMSSVGIAKAMHERRPREETRTGADMTPPAKPSRPVSLEDR